jgi:hypothetical protein
VIENLAVEQKEADDAADEAGDGVLRLPGHAGSEPRRSHGHLPDASHPTDRSGHTDPLGWSGWHDLGKKIQQSRPDSRFLAGSPEDNISEGGILKQGGGPGQVARSNPDVLKRISAEPFFGN